MKNLSNQQKGSSLAFIAVMFITPDSLFIRLSSIDTWGLLFYRGAIPFVAVLIGLLIFYKKNFIKAFLNVGYAGIFYIISFSICNITFIISIQNTNVANTLIMIAMAPMLSAILGAIFLKEVPDKKTWIAIAITLVAVVSARNPSTPSVRRSGVVMSASLVRVCFSRFSEPVRSVSIVTGCWDRFVPTDRARH